MLSVQPLTIQMHKSIVLMVFLQIYRYSGIFSVVIKWHTRKVRTGNHCGEYFTKRSVPYQNFALQAYYLLICVQHCRVFKCSVTVAVMVLNYLFCGFNVPLQVLACKLCVSSCIGFANFLKSRIRHDKAECQKHAYQGLVTTPL